MGSSIRSNRPSGYDSLPLVECHGTINRYDCHVTKLPSMSGRMIRTIPLSLALMLGCVMPLSAQTAEAPVTAGQSVGPLSQEPPPIDQLPAEELDVIVVTGETDREVVEELGKAITRPTRSGRPVARFDSDLCVTVSGLPDGMAAVVKERIEANVRAIRGLSVDNDPQCKPNAFVGVLNDVTETVDRLRKDEKWLFDGLLDYQVKRIYKGSEAVRAWHVFDLRNIDGTAIPGARSGGGDGNDLGSLVNNTGKASRIVQLKNNLVGAVVLIETSALQGKTFRQMADYATFRILASVSDEVDTSQTNLPTILTLFGEGATPPRNLTAFDQAYLESLYDLPANSRDGQIIAAAVSRYIAQFEDQDF